MTSPYFKSFRDPDETMELDGVIERQVELGDLTIGRQKLEPGRYLRWISDEATWQRFERKALADLETRFPDGVRSVSTARLAVGTKPA